MQTAILVSDCSRRGVQAVGRIAELIKECDMHPDTVGLIINRAPKGELNKGIQEEIANQGLTLLVLFHRMKQFMNMTVKDVLQAHFRKTTLSRLHFVQSLII